MFQNCSSLTSFNLSILIVKMLNIDSYILWMLLFNFFKFIKRIKFDEIPFFNIDALFTNRLLQLIKIKYYYIIF